jgi:hypothetical protein
LPAYWVCSSVSCSSTSIPQTGSIVIMGILLGGLFVLGQQQEPFRSHLCERLISRKLQLKPATAKYGLEKSARTVQTIHRRPTLRTTRKAYRSTCTSILVFAGPLAITHIRARLKPSDKRCCRKPRYTRDFCHTPTIGIRIIAFAEPEIHSLSQVPKDRHKRLSGRTLPVLKQCGESLGSLITVAESATSRTN